MREDRREMREERRERREERSKNIDLGQERGDDERQETRDCPDIWLLVVDSLVHWGGVGLHLLKSSHCFRLFCSTTLNESIAIVMVYTRKLK